jgi:hypothetical protein
VVLKSPPTALCAALLAVVLLPPVACHADSVTYAGEAFPVDSLVPVPPDQVTVSIAGSSFMVLEKNLGKRVALAYAQDARLAKSFPWSRYIGFVEKLTDPLDRDLLEGSAEMFLSSPELSPEERDQLAHAVARVDPSGTVLIPLIRSVGGAAQGGSVCMAIRALDEKGRLAAKESAQEVLLRYNAVCSEFSRKAARKHVSEGLLHQAALDLDVAISFFTLGAELDRSIVAARHRLTEMQKALDSRDAFMYRNAFQEAVKDPFLADVLKGSRTAIVQHVATTFVDEGLFDQALSVLTLVDFERRSESTHELVLRALTELEAQGLEVLQQEKVRRLLVEFALKDEAIKERLTSQLELLIGKGITSGDLSSVSALFDALREIRPDPSSANDQIRFTWTKRLLDQRQIAQAHSMLVSASRPPPVLLRANLIIKESPFLIVVVPAALIGIVGLLALGRRRAVDGNAREDAPQQPAEEQVVGGEEGADDQEKLRQARFVRYSPDLRGGGIRDEYEDLLAVFGVRPGVKLVHIKNAYRSAVKSCHPDLHRNASSGEAEKFIYLTQTYERLLRLHAERTGER